MSELSNENSTLYIGDLHFNVTEKVLFEKFMKYGTILAVHVARDNTTKKSLSYGYISFKNRYEAQSAIDSLNLTSIYGQACRVMWYERDPLKRKFGSGNIVVKNVNESITLREIHDTFSIFGKITSCKLKGGECGLFTSCAFLNYQYEKDSKKAIDAMNLKLLKGNTIIVQRYFPKDRILRDQSTDCYIDNFPTSFDNVALRMIFEKYGTVLCAKIMFNVDGSSKGFGIVSFKEYEDAIKATLELDGTELQKTRIHVYQITKKKQVSGCNLYINNLSENMTDERLRQLFLGFGKINSAKVILNAHSLKPAGYGFVAYYNREDGDDAVQEMNGKIVDGKALFVALKKVETNDTNQRQINNTKVTESPPNAQLSNQKVLNPLVSPWTMPFYPSPSMHPPHNFIRQPIAPSLGYDENEQVKQMLGEKIFPMVMKYAGDRSALIMNKIMELGLEELFTIASNESIVKTWVHRFIDTMDKDYYHHNRITKKPKKLKEQEKVTQTENSSEGICSSESSCDEDSDVQMKTTLCNKLHNSVKNIVGDSAKDVLQIFMKLSNTELFYMMEHGDYLRSKIEVIKNEQKVPNGVELKFSKGDQNSDKLSSETSHFVKHTPKIDSLTPKQLLAEKIYPLVSRHAGNKAGKITDLFMELDHSELLYMIVNEEYMRMKIELTMLRRGWNNSQNYNGSSKNISNDILKDDTLMSEIQDALKSIEVSKSKRSDGSLSSRENVADNFVPVLKSRSISPGLAFKEPRRSENICPAQLGTLNAGTERYSLARYKKRNLLSVNQTYGFSVRDNGADGKYNTIIASTQS